jgi:branched-chain amino acid transport system permease protein
LRAEHGDLHDGGRLMNLSLVLGAVVFGVLGGGVFAVMASGLTLIFGVMRIVNIGHGAVVVLGAYLSYVVYTDLGIDPFIGLLIVVPLMFVLGVALELLFIRPLKVDREELSVLVTFALALVIEGALTGVFGTNYVQITVPYGTDSFPVGGIYIAWVSVYGFLLAATVLLALYLLLYRTAFGASVRATMLNRTAAQLIGIDVERVSAITFGLGTATAAAGGVMFGITNAFDPGSHYDLILILLAIIVVGGFGSFRGAIVAAIGILVIESLGSTLIAPVWGGFSFFVILIVVLIVRPQGLFGQKLRDARA